MKNKLKYLLKDYAISLVMAGIFSFAGAGMIQTSNNLDWAYSNTSTKSKLIYFNSLENKLQRIQTSKEKLFSKTYFPFYSKLDEKDSKKIASWNKGSSDLIKEKEQIKQSILKEDPHLAGNYYGGKLYGWGFIFSSILTGFLVPLSLRSKF